jgi:hypothetical protein
MRLLSRIAFGNLFKYERTFNGSINDCAKRLLKILAMGDIKVTIKQPNINLTWNERKKKFQFIGTLAEDEGQTKLKGEFVLGTFRTITHLMWFSFWVIGYILWELGLIEFHKEGDDVVFFAFIIVGLVMLIAFLIKANKKVKEIVETIDSL